MNPSDTSRSFEMDVQLQSVVQETLAQTSRPLGRHGRVLSWGLTTILVLLSALFADGA